MSSIKLLPESLANQIAAGEVVQRPSSVVKELLENSVDAEATKIILCIKDAGKKLVQVIDNGKGMDALDAKLCFERHATSKISRAEDLFTIKTLGFRGEALASIAAVSQIEMKTKIASEELGTYIEIEGSKFIKTSPIATPAGTNIMVKNLFFNIPARRAFLKSNFVELKHIYDEFYRIAIAYPEIQFEFFNHDQNLFKLMPSKLSQRIVALFGNSYREQLIPVEETIGEYNIKGYVGKPAFAKKTRGEQFFFINKRYFRSGYLNNAITEAYGNLLHKNTYPFFVLFIKVDPHKVDVNVHPTKTEVKFEDEKTIYSLVLASVRKALGKHLLEPSFDFDLDVNFFDNFKSNETVKNNSIFDETDSNSRFFYKKISEETKLQKTNTHSDFKNFKSIPLNVEYSGESLPLSNVQSILEINSANNLNNFFQIHNQYILVQVKEGIMLIDQVLASERIAYEKYLNILQKKHGLSQQLLFPTSIELPIHLLTVVQNIESEIKNLGFSFTYSPNNTLILNGVPPNIEKNNEKEVFIEMLEIYYQFYNEKKLAFDLQEKLALALAQKTSLKKGIKLEPVEMEKLIAQLFSCQNPNYSPLGAKTHVLVTLDQIRELLI